MPEARIKKYRTSINGRFPKAVFTNKGIGTAIINNEGWFEITIINNGKLDAVVIPKSDRNGFLDFVVSVEKDGYTKAAKTYAIISLYNTVEGSLSCD